MSWIRDALSANVRKQHTPEELAKARKEEAEKGHGSVFESLPHVVEKAGESGQVDAVTEISTRPDQPKPIALQPKKATEVCVLRILST
jgi:flagellar biosynthesis/type III secretory pathway ATPase